MLEKSTRRRSAPAKAGPRPVVYRELTGAEVAGYELANREITSRERDAPKILGKLEPDDPLWHDAASLVAIARRHAALALASPSDLREAGLAACRTVWTRYAAAFNASAKMQERFADELLEVTRALMVAQQASAGPPNEPRVGLHPTWSPQAGAFVITLEELRPILQQITRE